MLKRDSNYGIFAIALEDMFNLGDQKVFLTQEEFDVWYYSKIKEMHLYIKDDLLPEVKRKSNILGLILTTTLLPSVSGTTKLTRNSKAMMFKRGGLDSKTEATAESFLKALTPSGEILKEIHC